MLRKYIGIGNNIKILIVAWEFPGMVSQQGTALSKRIGQIGNGLANKGHEVSVLRRNQYLKLNAGMRSGIQTEPDEDSSEDGNQLPVSDPSNTFWFIRPFITGYQLLSYGDFTGYALKDSLEKLKDKLEKPDIILSFFTPRGPFFLARQIAGYFKRPYILDFQDNYDIGLRRSQRFISLIWMRRMCRTAAACVHVSPEWAGRDGHHLKKEFKVLRHAVPSRNWNAGLNRSDKFTILYGGSINVQNQSPICFIEGFVRALVENPNLIFKFAGIKSSADYFRQRLPENNFIDLGWLDEDAFNKEVAASDTLLLIGWSRAPRKVVPSKLYEYVSYNKPVLIAGEDTGGIMSLLGEWEHPCKIMDTVEKVKNAILEGSQNKFSNYLLPEICRNIFYEEDLVNEYESLIVECLR